MNQERTKTLRRALEPLREAVTLLGDALVGAKDDGTVKEEINDAFTLTDDALEHIEIVSGSLFRSKPRPFLAEIALGELRDEDVGAVRAYDESLLEGRVGLGADQRATGLRDALRLMRKAQISLDAARDAEREAIEHIPEDICWSEPTIFQPYDHISDACEALSGAIETVRSLTGLPPSPLIVLNEKIRALYGALGEERNRVDAETPEVMRLKGQHDCLWEQAKKRSYGDSEWERLCDEGIRLNETMDQIREADERYAEARRLRKEIDLVWEE